MPTAHSDQQCPHSAREQHYRCRLRNRGTDHAHREVVLAIAVIVCVVKERAKEDAIEADVCAGIALTSGASESSGTGIKTFPALSTVDKIARRA